MMTEEEFQRNLIKMWDSIRSTHKGEETCDGVCCANCPLNKEVCRVDTNTVLHSYKAIEIVENWAKEHPIVTNADKFREVFGKEIRKDSCVNPTITCEDCEYCNGCECDAGNRFWDVGYKEQAMGYLNGLV